MNWPVPQPGLVVRYSYLWEREALEGRRRMRYWENLDTLLTVFVVRGQDDGAWAFLNPLLAPLGRSVDRRGNSAGG